jgi:acyl carrier protein
MSVAGAADEKIRNFIVERFPLAKKQGLKNTDALLESGILDSLGVLDVVGFIEREFSITIADDELLPENFQNVAALSAFVHSKSGNSA